ncbi:MAG TPA: NAD-dependent deacylase [Pyrinomonadaceae bacterium]|nr:NAD-dependent deacylase [Pyrinomonadaceae bacterium]
MSTRALESISADLCQRFRAATSVLVLTGAGVSAESGVPTFRGGGGAAVWKGMPFDVISSARMVERDLSAVREWFDYRRALIKELSPNPAHLAIARWQERFKNFLLVTQNIDGLHTAAGSRDIIELHGNIWRARCITCGALYDLSDAQTKSSSDDACEACGDHLRPDVVLFGELIPLAGFQRAVEHARSCDLCFVIGTSALVYPAAALPEVARAAGAYTVEINPERTPLSELCDEVIQGRAGEILPLFEAL